jgi:hypothetical protein
LLGAARHERHRPTQTRQMHRKRSAPGSGSDDAEFHAQRLTTKLAKDTKKKTPPRRVSANGDVGEGADIT